MHIHVDYRRINRLCHSHVLFLFFVHGTRRLCPVSLGARLSAFVAPNLNPLFVIWRAILTRLFGRRVAFGLTEQTVTENLENRQKARLRASSRQPVIRHEWLRPCVANWRRRSECVLFFTFSCGAVPDTSHQTLPVGIIARLSCSTLVGGAGGTRQSCPVDARRPARTSRVLV
jgi:hypothetical protein